MKLLLLVGLLFAFKAQAIPLETFQSFATDHPEEATRTQSCALVVRGSGTDSMYWLELDPTTGKLPVDATVTSGAVELSKVELIYNDHSSTAIGTGAYTELVASTSAQITQLQIFDSSGEALILATGAASSEVDQMYIPPGGMDYPVNLLIAAGTRISVKALTGATSVGDLIITALD